ncbi:hypothetical protein N1031_18860 [Herbiconiux moechotypicola]|uniref:Uncharacterized protein n=1 Tax=Herbiconiux moechotypicola TaxID=637393 RepID=A0ABN3E629_9MICO|nr:hypothetical protein [Herbiconiux moechotypicola]MCS5731821.1 hypothetical protein [Herbiconiux moechotypicola]
MSIPEFDLRRRAAVRRMLADTVSAPRRARRVPWAGFAAFVLAGLLAGGAVTAASASFGPSTVVGSVSGEPVDPAEGLDGMPALVGTPPGAPIPVLVGGAQSVIIEADGSSLYPAPEGSGWTAVIPLAPPERATHMRVATQCLTPGAVRAGQNADGNNGSSTCGGPWEGPVTGPRTGQDEPLSDGLIYYVDLDPGTSVVLTFEFLLHVETTWGVNARGETYGTYKEGAGEPDLLSASGTNGARGYVRRSELAFVDGTAAMEGFRSFDDVTRWQEETAGRTYLVPVYESDGVTVIGEMQVGG